VGTTRKAYTDLDNAQDWRGRGILQGLYTSQVPEEDWMDVLVNLYYP
jgi:hypothetical protein